jgi:hypothetical protein
MSDAYEEPERQLSIGIDRASLISELFGFAAKYCEEKFLFYAWNGEDVKADFWRDFHSSAEMLADYYSEIHKELLEEWRASMMEKSIRMRKVVSVLDAKERVNE